MNTIKQDHSSQKPGRYDAEKGEVWGQSEGGEEEQDFGNEAQAQLGALIQGQVPLQPWTQK